MGKTVKVHFSGSVVLSDIKMHLNFWRSRSCSDLGQRSLVCHLSTFQRSSLTTETIPVSSGNGGGGGGGRKFMYLVEVT